MSSKDQDLMRLHAMAAMNTPLDAEEREKSMEEYRKHREHCVKQYGLNVVWQAEMYMPEPKRSTEKSAPATIL